MRTAIHLLLLAAILLMLWAVQPSANPDLGLILRYVDEVNGRVVLANIYDVKAQTSYEYFVGDYVTGLRLQQILPDRVVLLDEIGKTQYVLVLNGEEDAEPEEVTVTHRRHRKRQIDEMDVTADFNRELARAEGTYRLFGAADAQSEADAEQSLLGRAAPLGGEREREMKGSPLRDASYGPETGSDNPFDASRSGSGPAAPIGNPLAPPNPFDANPPSATPGNPGGTPAGPGGK